MKASGHAHGTSTARSKFRAEDNALSPVGNSLSRPPRVTPWIASEITGPVCRTVKGFSLIELIGVLAVMSILATVLVPNALRSIENAAITAEDATLSNLAEQVRTYTRQNGVLPGAATWSADLATISDLAAADILTNKRRIQRVYAIDPVAPGQRVLIISSMRPSLPLPTAATVRANFAAIWNTAPQNVPPGFSAAWSTPATQQAFNLGHLVIQRVNVQPIFLTDLRTFTVNVNSLSSSGTIPVKTVSYRFTPYTGTVVNGTVGPGAATNTINTVHPRDRIDFYTDSTWTTLGYSFVFSTNGSDPKTFDFDAALSQWIPR